MENYTDNCHDNDDAAAAAATDDDYDPGVS